jgi:hypothetical protein
LKLIDLAAAAAAAECIAVNATATTHAVDPALLFQHSSASLPRQSGLRNIAPTLLHCYIATLLKEKREERREKGEGWAPARVREG